MKTSGIQTYRLNGFDDSRCGRSRWNELVKQSDTHAVFLTWEWQRAWWDSFERSGLLIIGAEKNGELVAIAPLFSEAGMVYFIGSGGSDYLDFIGDISDEEVLDSLLRAAIECVDDFAGFLFYHVLENSHTGKRLEGCGTRLGLTMASERGMAAPFMNLSDQADIVRLALDNKRVLQVQRWLEREAPLTIERLSDGVAIQAHLDQLMQQHIDRWASTPYQSQFLQVRERTFLSSLTNLAANQGWLRFTRILWKGDAIACHFGFCYEGSYFCYKPTFDVRHARRSPGQVLIRHLILTAMDEGAHTFDFGLGDEPYKDRYATGRRYVNNWGLYPSDKPLPEFLQ